MVFFVFCHSLCIKFTYTNIFAFVIGKISVVLFLFFDIGIHLPILRLKDKITRVESRRFVFGILYVQLIHII